VTTRTLRLAAAGALLGAALASGVAVRSWLGERAFAQGRALQERGDLLGAAARYEFALGRGRAGAGDELARIALLRRRWEEAEARARDSLALAPASSYPHVLLASVALSRPGPWDAAREERVLGECRAAVSIERLSSGVWGDCGVLALGLAVERARTWGPARVEEVLGIAEASIARAVTLAPRSARRVLATALERGASPMLAVRSAAESEGRLPLRAAVALLLERRVWENTREDFEAEALRRGDRARFALAAAEALGGAGEVEGAVGLAREAAEAAPEDAESWFVLGGLLRRARRRDEAAAAFGRAAELAPGNAAYRRAAGLPPADARGH